MTIRSRRPLTLVATLCLATWVGAPGQALDEMSIKDVANIQDNGASERVNYSGKLRMLSQRIAAAACNLQADVAPELSAKILAGGAAEFKKIAAALEKGDPDLKIIGVETRRKTLYAITNLNEKWGPIQTATQALLTQGHSDEAATTIAQQNMPLLSMAKLLVSELSGQYSDPSLMLQSDAMLVDISGRQRMLSQKMSKEACQIWSGGDATEIGTALAGTMSLFEVSLLALRDGLTAAGVEAAPTPQIHGNLDAIYSDWVQVKVMLQEAVDGQPLSTTGREDVFLRLNKILKEMNTTVGLYAAHAKTGL